ncbi:MAG: BlaI/MecI/CopY family transcriptional regulator [candidate division NC10 bacterium]|nr:BlaI/MecI/CopY family transcriptional regulator [candidate division NC10 bacterium]
MSRLSQIFRLGGRGFLTVLGELEEAIMQVVWDRGEVSVRDVHGVLSRSRRIAYTTVMTTMVRLARKDLLHQKRARVAYLYSPKVSRDELADSVVRGVADSLLRSFGSAAVSGLLGRIQEEEPAAIAAIARLIQKRRGQR